MKKSFQNLTYAMTIAEYREKEKNGEITRPLTDNPVGGSIRGGSDYPTVVPIQEVRPVKKIKERPDLL